MSQHEQFLKKSITITIIKENNLKYLLQANAMIPLVGDEKNSKFNGFTLKREENRESLKAQVP